MGPELPANLSRSVIHLQHSHLSVIRPSFYFSPGCHTVCVSLGDVVSLFHGGLCLLLGSSSAEILCGTEFTTFLNFNYNYAAHTIIVNQSAL